MVALVWVASWSWQAAAEPSTAPPAVSTEQQPAPLAPTPPDDPEARFDAEAAAIRADCTAFLAQRGVSGPRSARVLEATQALLAGMRSLVLGPDSDTRAAIADTLSERFGAAVVTELGEDGAEALIEHLEDRSLERGGLML